MIKSTVVLLAEDSADDVFFFQRTLSKTNHPVTLHIVENGRVATDYLLNKGAFADAAKFPRPDIVFIDLKMPEMNGFELLTWIYQQFPEVPFRAIVLTSSDEPKDYQQALDCGAHGYFLKPVSVEQLLAQLEGRTSASEVES